MSKRAFSPFFFAEEYSNFMILHNIKIKRIKISEYQFMSSLVIFWLGSSKIDVLP